MNEQSPPKKLTRSRSDRYVGGVAAGIADFLGIPSLVVRAVFAISLVFGAVGGFTYLSLLLLIPEDDSPAPAEPTGSKRYATVGGAAFLTLVVVLAILEGGFAAWLFGFGPGFLAGLAAWTLAVIVVIWLGGEAMRGERKAPQPTETPASTVSTTAKTETFAPTPSATAPTATAPTKTVTPQRKRDRTAGKVTGWIVVGVASLIAYSVFFGTAFWVTAAYGALPVAALVILLGAGVALCSMTARRILALWLLGTAISLAIPMAFVSIIDLRIEGPYGDINKEPRVAGSIPPDGYEIAAGSLTIDLREYPFEKGKPVKLPVDSGLAYTEIVVPDDVCVTGQVRGKLGATDIRARTEAGSNFTLDLDPPPAPVKELDLDADVGMGYLELYDETVWRWINVGHDGGPHWERPLNQEGKRGRQACDPVRAADGKKRDVGSDGRR